MCGIIFAFIVFAAILAAVLHVSAGWGIGIAAAIIVIAAIAQTKNPNATKRVAKTGLMFTNVCPACRKHNKSRATVCRHCGTALVVKATGAPVAAVATAPTAPESATKVCPDCAETVLAAARKCRFCGYMFDGS